MKTWLIVLCGFMFASSGATAATNDGIEVPATKPHPDRGTGTTQTAELHFRCRHGEVRFQFDTLAGPVAPATAAASPSAQHLALVAFADRAASRLQFDIVLPRAGGSLELFDVAGRRRYRANLASLGSGAHSLVLDGGTLPAGVYWARLRQTGGSASARVIWIR